jgi:hypothetical protein
VCPGREAYNVTVRTLATVGLNIFKVQPDVYTPFNLRYFCYIFRFEQKVSENPLNYVSIDAFFTVSVQKRWCLTLFNRSYIKPQILDI